MFENRGKLKIFKEDYCGFFVCLTDVVIEKKSDVAITNTYQRKIGEKVDYFLSAGSCNHKGIN